MTKAEADILKRLAKAAEDRGLLIVQRSPQHFQIENGHLLVNYYPFSKKRTAYVEGTAEGVRDVTPERAVQMAMEMPKGDKVERRKSYKKDKLALLQKDPHCAWCGCELTAETATVDHVVPLSRGGLNNRNNMVLACQPCNAKRGNSVLVLEQEG